MKKRTITLSAVIILLLLTAAGCASRPVALETDTPDQLIQKAQESYDKGNSYDAVYFYQTMLDWYGDSNAEYLVIGKYEIAHLLVKQGKTDTAVQYLTELLQLYDDETLTQQLPADYRKLATLELNRIKNKK